VSSATRAALVLIAVALASATVLVVLWFRGDESAQESPQTQTAPSRNRRDPSPSASEPPQNLTEPSPTTSAQSQPSADPSRNRPEATGPATSMSPSTREARGLLYLRNLELRRIDLRSGRDVRIGAMPTKDVVASRVSPWLAYVVPQRPQPGARPDFVPDPLLRAVDIESGEDRLVGPGFSPLWHPARDWVAYLHPHERRRCLGERCDGLSTIAVYDPATDEATTLTRPGRFVLLGWSGDDIVFSNEADLSSTLTVGPDGTFAALPLPPSEYWGAAPNGSLLLRSRPGRAVVLSPSGEPLRRLGIGREALAEGAWSPNGDRIAAVVLDNRGRSTVSLVDPRSGSISALERAEATTFTWHETSKSFAFVAADPQAFRADLMLCEIGAAECESVGRGPARISLLRLE
jgi:hypothetical protein